MTNSTSEPRSSGTPLVRPQVTLGFTGSRVVPIDMAGEVLYLAEQIGADAPGFVTGGCVGIDHTVGRFLAGRYPKRYHVVIVPANRSRVAAWWRAEEFQHVVVVEMAPGTSYADRNQAIVDASEQLVGFPAEPEEHPSSRRSGSWQTIRMAARIHSRAPITYPLSSL